MEVHDIKISQVYSVEQLWWKSTLGSGSGLGAVRQQAIIWTNIDPDLCHRVAPQTRIS